MVDRYTRVVLTVIAVALVAIATERLIPGATADDVTRVAICDTSGTRCVDVKELDSGDQAGDKLAGIIVAPGQLPQSP